MRVTLEQIDELRRRVNCTYEEARTTLEANDGDLIKSIIELEKRKGKTTTTKRNDGFKNFSERLLQLRFNVKNEEAQTLIDVPLVLVLLTFILAFWVVAIGIFLALVTNCKIKIFRAKKYVDVNDITENVKDTVNKFKVKAEEMFKSDDTVNNNNKSDDTDEIIIE